ncbi:GIDE domain-containing protein [Nanoarchaeota archaeon]
MVDLESLGYCIAGMGIGGFLFYKGFKWFKTKRMIENMPTSKIRGLAMGLVEIAGNVVPAKKTTLKSPLTGKSCVYYKYSVKEERGSGKHRYWYTLKAGTDMQEFFLKDSTGKVLVQPQKAQIDIPPDFKYQSRWRKDPPQVVQKFLKKNSLNFETFLGTNKNMRYYEYYIAPKDKLYILGHAGDNPHVEEATGQQNTEDIMIQKGDEGIYYISDSSEEGVLKKFKWKVIGGLFGGGALIVICLALFLLQLGIY